MNTSSSATKITAPFQRPMAVAGIRRDSKTKFNVSAVPEELIELAQYLNVNKISNLKLFGNISPVEGDGWRIHGRLVASIEQPCIVSLAPMTARHDTEVERFYLPEDQIISEQEVLISHDDQDVPDPFTDILDPALLAVEELAQLIAPYPRSKGAELAHSQFAPPGTTPLTDETSLPFAGLAVLKHGSDDQGTE